MRASRRPARTAPRRPLPRRGARRRHRDDRPLRLVVRERRRSGRRRRRIAGDQVTLVPSIVGQVRDRRPRRGLLAGAAGRPRRSRRALHDLESPETGAGGDILTLDRPVTAPAGALGLAVRRWDGEAVGAAAATKAAFRGDDLGVTFTAGAGAYVAGDWWGARVREEEGAGIELRPNAAPGRHPPRLRAARARRPRRPRGAPRLPADVRSADRAEARRGLVHGLGSSRRRPAGSGRQPPGGRWRALPGGGDLPAARPAAREGAQADRGHRRRARDDPARDADRGGASSSRRRPRSRSATSASRAAAPGEPATRS